MAALQENHNEILYTFCFSPFLDYVSSPPQFLSCIYANHNGWLA